jgi:hypothetical protein
MERFAFEGGKRRLPSRRMKGDYAFLTDFVGIILFASAVVALILFVQASLAKFSADMKVSEIQLQAVDAAHLIKDCLTVNGDSIPSSLKNVDFCKDCKICSANIGVKIDYLEGLNKGKTLYESNYTEGAEYGMGHSIFVTVADGANSYVSRLSVRVYTSSVELKQMTGGN